MSMNVISSDINTIGAEMKWLEDKPNTMLRGRLAFSGRMGDPLTVQELLTMAQERHGPFVLIDRDRQCQSRKLPEKSLEQLTEAGRCLMRP
ncbi:hypothetical protein AYL99_11987 [Fonsecaea erecta]|uniref:Uncharacterized protein n=1 Tax=Fonsecaea erecta TaxID=1367422 RepID=A0A178Z2R4_9EURO|nr:hypothetical protein AYL99_11987 [Fonsecaea erecta]OAP53801.1 hypothetical protein AYL99_11987 [Fonsecaea erecta]